MNLERKKKSKLKFAIPIQPRNANGTFAPCKELEEEKSSSVVSLQKPGAEKRMMVKDRQRTDRDVYRASSQMSHSASPPKEIFKIGKFGSSNPTGEGKAASVSSSTV